MTAADLVDELRDQYNDREFVVSRAKAIALVEQYAHEYHMERSTGTINEAQAVWVKPADLEQRIEDGIVLYWADLEAWAPKAMRNTAHHMSEFLARHLRGEHDNAD